MRNGVIPQGHIHDRQGVAAGTNERVRKALIRLDRLLF
jgi:hypothetical protein